MGTSRMPNECRHGKGPLACQSVEPAGTQRKTCETGGWEVLGYALAGTQLALAFAAHAHIDREAQSLEAGFLTSCDQVPGHVPIFEDEELKHLGSRARGSNILESVRGHRGQGVQRARAGRRARGRQFAVGVIKAL